MAKSKAVKHSEFELEALEPRIMLSATEGASAVAGAVTTHVVVLDDQQVDAFDDSSELNYKPGGINPFEGMPFAENEKIPQPVNETPQSSGKSQVATTETPTESVNITVGDDNVVSGTGTYEGDLGDGVVLRPGNSPGKITITGNLDLSGSDTDTLSPEPGGPVTPNPAGKLFIELGGTDPSTPDYDQVVVNGDLTLGGQLDITLLGGFDPVAGNTFDIITYDGALTGSFADATGLYGFGDGSLYFDINLIDNASGSDVIQLEVKSLFGETVDKRFLPDFASIANDAEIQGLGKLFSDYFSDIDVSVTGGKFNIADTIDVEGDFTFQKVDDQINIGATGVDALLGQDLNGAGESGVKITGADLGLILKNGGVATDFSGSASLVGFSDFSLSGNNLNLRLNSTGTILSETIGLVTVGFSTTDEVFEFSGTLSGGITDFVNLSGDFGFIKNGTRIEAGVTNVDALLENTSYSVGVSGGVLALILENDGTYAFEASGFVSLTGNNLSNPASADASVTKNTTSVDYEAAPLTIVVGDFETTLSVGSNVESVSIEGLSVDVTNFVNLSGNFGFRKTGGVIEATADSVDAQLVNSSYSVGVTGGTLAMLLNDDGTRAFEASGAFNLSGGDFANATAMTVFVRENTTATDYSLSPLNLAIDGVSADLTTASGVQLISVTGLTAEISGFVDISGDFGFRKSTDQIEAAAINATASMSAGNFEIGLSAGTLGFILNTDETKVLSASGLFSFNGNGFLTASAALASLEFNDTGSNVNQDVTIGGVTTTIDVDDGLSRILATDLNLTAGDFFHVEGSFGFEKSSGQLALDNGDFVDAEMIQLGAQGVSAFAGLNGGTADAYGFQLNGVDFGLLLASDSIDAIRSWLGLKANASSISFAGAGDDVSAASNNLSVTINLAAADGTVMDLLAQSVDVATGTSTSITLDMDGGLGELVRASGDVNLELSGFFQISGSFGLDKSIGTVTVDGADVDVDQLLLGASNVSAFVGLNGGTVDATGLELTGVNFALALLSDASTPERKWSSLKGDASSAGFTGLGDDFDISASQIEILINRAAASDGSVVDYSASPLAIEVSPTGQTIDLDMASSAGELISAVASVSLVAAGFVNIKGRFGFISSKRNLTTTDGTTPADLVDADVLTIGGTGVTTFAGLNGGSDDAIGLNLSDVDFGLAIVQDSVDKTQRYVSLQATAGSAGFTDSDDIELSGSQITVEVNLQAANSHVVDYNGTNDDETGLAILGGLTLDMDGNLGELIRASGNVELKILDFVSVNGGFAFEKSNDSVSVSGVVDPVAVDKLTIGASNVNLFAGLNGGSPEAFGLSLSDANLALAILTDQSNPALSWIALKADAAAASFVGGDSLELSGETLSVEINSAASDLSLVDFETEVHFYILT